jgi:hypothetical protein
MTDFCRSVFKKETIVEVMLLKREQIIDRLAEHAIRRKIEERFSLDEEAFFESIFGKDIGVKMKSREQKLQEIDKRIEALKYLKDNHRQSLAIIRKKLEDFEFGDRTKDIEREMEYYFRNKISNWKNWKKAISAEG